MGRMTKKRAGLSDWLRGMVALCAVLLLAAPALASAAQPLGDCCAGAPCHEMGKATCPSLCVMACQAVVAPDAEVVEASGFGPVARPFLNAVLPAGRTPSPETPPPRVVRS
jgi:hypothetical protein